MNRNFIVVLALGAGALLLLTTRRAEAAAPDFLLPDAGIAPLDYPFDDWTYDGNAAPAYVLPYEDGYEAWSFPDSVEAANESFYEPEPVTAETWSDAPMSDDFTFSVTVPPQYQSPIVDAANEYGVPPDLLARLLWQESRFRDDIVYCQTLSSAGAQGIAQFMPATAADVGARIGGFDPCEPFGSIRASAYYLASLYKQTGNWLDAVAAYNWGIGNVLKYRRGEISSIPLETRNYTAGILGQTYA